MPVYRYFGRFIKNSDLLKFREIWQHCIYVLSRQYPSNKWINFAYRLPFPIALLQWKHLPAQIIYPRVYSQIRSEKSRSIRMHTAPPSSTVATVRGKRYATDPLYWKAGLAFPAQSQWKVHNRQNNTSTSTKAGRTQLKWKVVPPSSEQSIFKQFIIATPREFNDSHINTLGCKIFTS